MPLKGVQNWVNGWVNVNSNHVVYHDDDSVRQHRSSNNGDSNHQRISFGDQGAGGRGHSTTSRGAATEGRGMIPVMGDGSAILDSRRGESSVNNSGVRRIEGTRASPSTAASNAIENGSGQQRPNTDINKMPYKKSGKKVKLLKKTNSQSDLLKEKAATKRDQMINNHQGLGGDNGSGIIDTIAGLTQHLNRGHDTTTRRSSNSGSTNSTLMRDNKMHQAQIYGPGNMNNASNMHPPFRSTGQYVNEKAFANQHRSSQLNTATDDSSMRGTSKLHTKGNNNINVNRPRATSNGSKSRVPPQLSFDHNNDAIDNNIPEPLHMKHFSSSKPAQNPALMAGSTLQNHGVGSHPHPSQMQMPGNKTQMNHEGRNSKQNQHKNICQNCTDAEDKIQALESDLEYLRLLALQSEFTCSECESNTQSLTRVSSSASIASGRTSRSNKSGRISHASGKHPPSINSGVFSSTTGGGTSKRKDKRGRNFSVDGMNHRLPEPIALAESSQRLIDVTARYKRQIENMTRETARWQNDMHLKLSKLAMMCKDLNDESAKRKEQSDVAKSELSRVRSERDSKSSELEILRARVALYEKQEVENTEIRRKLREDETDTLDIAHAAIIQRDALIQDLTTRLDDAHKMLEEEREQRRVLYQRDISKS